MGPATIMAATSKTTIILCEANGRTQFANWFTQRESVCMKKDCWIAVTDPGNTGANVAALQSKAYGLLMDAIAEDLYPVTRNIEKTPTALLAALEAHFFLRCNNNLSALKHQLWGIRLQPGQPTSTLFDSIRITEERIGAQGSAVPSADKIAIVLGALPSDYSGLIAQLNAQAATLIGEDEGLTYEYVRTAVELYETTLASSQPARRAARDHALLFNAPVTPDSDTCERCGIKGHTASTCRRDWSKCPGAQQAGNQPRAARNNGNNRGRQGQQRQGQRHTDECHICHRKGHWGRDCPDNNRAPTNRDNKTRAYTVLSAVANCLPTFVLDTGATRHIVNNRDIMHVSVPTDSTVIGVGGHATQATAIGTLRHYPGEALCVPQSQDNILSVQQLAGHGWTAAFNDSGAVLTDFDGNTYNAIADREGLYRVAHDLCYTARNTGATDMTTWHVRLGHLGEIRLRAVCSAADIDTSDWPAQLPTCTACDEAKSTKAPVRHHVTHDETDRQLRPGERLDVDLVGPMPTSPSGKRFALEIVDRHTRMRWVVPLNRKSDAANAMADFLDRTLAPLMRFCDRIHADRGGEFTSSDWTTMCTERGISSTYAATDTPAHNGLAERAHRGSVETARVLLASANLSPSTFWVPAYEHATLVLNMSPTRALGDNLTPFQAWTGSPPPITRLLAFGCSVLYHAPGGKFGKQAKPGIYLGPALDTTGGAARVYCPDTKRVIVTRDFKPNEAAIIAPAPAGPPAEPAPVAAPVPEPEPVPAVPLDSDDSEDEGFAEVDYFVPERRAADALSPPPLPRKSANERKRLGLPVDANPAMLPTRTRSGANVQGEQANADRALIAIGAEPKHYKAAANSPDAAKWEHAMRDELRSLYDQGAWTVVPRKSDMNIVGSRWVYKIKTDANNNPVRYKARVVARGFTQIEGIDYDTTSAPVASKDAVRICFALAAQYNWHAEQFDVDTAYLYATLEENIFMAPPPGLPELWSGNMSERDLQLIQSSRGVLRLNKALYGLKQSGRRWYDTVRAHIETEHSARATETEPCVFVGPDFVLFIYVDDGVIMSANISTIDKFLDKLSQTFNIKRLGTPSHLLGWGISRDRNGAFTIGQRGYATAIGENYSAPGERPKSTPMVLGAALDPEGPAGDHPLFMELLGSLLFAAIGTRPDISAAVSILARHMSAPTRAHVTAARHIVNYLANTADLSLHYGRDSSGQINLEVYADASFAPDEQQRKSRTGWIILINGAPVSWKSALQPVIAHSTAEAEYIALSDAAREATYVARFIAELGYSHSGPIIMYEDNQVAARMAAEVATKRSKHLDIRYHHIRALAHSGDIAIVDCRTDDMLADLLTKPLARDRFALLRQRLLAKGEC